jgi:uncharacterized membrane protein YeaQ/YmgE (transglycosylase-associated protein family)
MFQRPISLIPTAALLAFVGLVAAFIFDEASIRIFLFAPYAVSWGVSAELMVIVMQISGAVFTILGGMVGAYAAYFLLRRFSIDRSRPAALLSAVLWGAMLYAAEIASIESDIPVEHSRTILLLFAGRLAIDLLSIVLFWYILRRKLLGGLAATV